MGGLRRSLQHYIDWVIRLGRWRFSVLGIVVLATFAIFVQFSLSLVFLGGVNWTEISLSICFGLISAPFVIYFFNVLVEKLELSRQQLSESNSQLSELLKKLKYEIEQKNKAEMALTQKADFLRAFIDASPDLVFSRLNNSHFLDCNRAMELLTGKTKNELRQLSVEQIFSPEIANYIRETDRDVLAGNDSVTYEQWLQYPNKKWVCFEIRKVPYYDQIRQQHCLMGFGRDITERKRYQETIEKASRDKTALMATISHELRTPLNGIIGLSQILLDGDLNDEQRNYLQTINISAISLGHIFSDIIDLEKLDTRRIKLFYQETNFYHLLNNISNFATLMAQQKGLTFRLEYPKNLPDFISIDQARISQILWNLISNAVKFTPKGEICLQVKRLDSHHYSISVIDTGIGIPTAEQRKIFAMFYQVKGSENKALGSGIGLSISKRIARLMNGDLTVHSQLGEGSTFIFTFRADEIKKSTSSQQINLTNFSVLLVEDIQVNIIVARSILEKLGCKVEVATDGKTAIKKVHQTLYDLVLLDIHLPDMTGFEIAKKLHKSYQQEQLEFLPPLVALTANVVSDKQDYLCQGLDDVLQKPLSVDALFDCLKNILDLPQSESGETQSSFEKTDLPIINNCSKKIELEADVYDSELILALLEMLGSEIVLKNLQLFQQTMPTYLLASQNGYQIYLQQGERKVLADIAHKIKGAAAAIGLKRIQQLAQLAQDQQALEWQDNIAKWLEQITLYWQQDVTTLEKYIKLPVRENPVSK
ncbi:hybrid sensor histidine kinase/response regulator [Mergibacter septicus]|uniref:ATP-binding protein n=1 Tax=Mergibacter septicus TaxID=221402 RepID=UPI0011794B35|nr:ATP-binding protein [Mergibacter septicus]AWX13829.1 hybrid sensor histidine kinase/response regulator [Mergibacter septicus]